MRIGIYAPYDTSELTHAAVRLASLAHHYGFTTRYVAAVNRDAEIHPYWDQHVRSARKTKLSRWVADNDCCVWFWPHRRRFEEAARAGGGNTRHIIVPPWHDLTEADLEWLHWFDKIACPSKRMRDDLVDKIRNSENILTWCRWTAGMRPLKKEGTRVKGRIRVAVLLDGYTIERHGDAIIDLVHLLLGVHSHLDLTLLHLRSWNRKQGQFLATLQRKYGERLQTLRRLSLSQQVHQIHEHDWAWLPSIKVSNAMLAHTALCCGSPVLTWNVCPQNEIIVDGHNGRLVACSVERSEMGAPIVQWDGDAMRKAAVETFTDSAMLTQLRGHTWHRQQADDAFSEFWRQLWAD